MRERGAGPQTRCDLCCISLETIAPDGSHFLALDKRFNDDKSGYTLSTASALWVDDSFSLLGEYEGFDGSRLSRQGYEPGFLWSER